MTLPFTSIAQQTGLNYLAWHSSTDSPPDSYMAGVTKRLAVPRPTSDEFSVPDVLIIPAGYPFSYTMPPEAFRYTGPVTWSATNLPPGLTITGRVISGTPTMTGEFMSAVMVTDTEQQSAELRLPMKIVAASPIPPQETTVNGTFAYTIPFSSFPNYISILNDPDNLDARPEDFFELAVNGLPPGISQNKRIIAGSASTAGLFMVTAVLYDGTGRDVAITFPFTVTAKVDPNPCPPACIPFTITVIHYPHK